MHCSVLGSLIDPLNFISKIRFLFFFLSSWSISEWYQPMIWMCGSWRFVTKQADDAVCSLLSVTNTYTFTVLSQCTKHIRNWTSGRSVCLSFFLHFDSSLSFLSSQTEKENWGFHWQACLSQTKTHRDRKKKRPLTLPTMANVTAQAAIHSLTNTHTYTHILVHTPTSTLPCIHKHTQMESQSASHTHSQHPSGTQSLFNTCFHSSW